MSSTKSSQTKPGKKKPGPKSGKSSLTSATPSVATRSVTNSRSTSPGLQPEPSSGESKSNSEDEGEDKLVHEDFDEDRAEQEQTTENVDDLLRQSMGGYVSCNSVDKMSRSEGDDISKDQLDGDADAEPEPMEMEEDSPPRRIDIDCVIKGDTTLQRLANDLDNFDIVEKPNEPTLIPMNDVYKLTPDLRASFNALNHRMTNDDEADANTRIAFLHPTFKDWLDRLSRALMEHHDILQRPNPVDQDHFSYLHDAYSCAIKIPTESFTPILRYVSTVDSPSPEVGKPVRILNHYITDKCVHFRILASRYLNPYNPANYAGRTDLVGALRDNHLGGTIFATVHTENVIEALGPTSPVLFSYLLRVKHLTLDMLLRRHAAITGVALSTKDDRVQHSLPPAATGAGDTVDPAALTGLTEILNPLAAAAGAKTVDLVASTGGIDNGTPPVATGGIDNGTPPVASGAVKTGLTDGPLGAEPRKRARTDSDSSEPPKSNKTIRRSSRQKS